MATGALVLRVTAMLVATARRYGEAADADAPARRTAETAAVPGPE